MSSSWRWRRITRSNGKSRAAKLEGKRPEKHSWNNPRSPFFRRNCQDGRHRNIFRTQRHFFLYYSLVWPLPIRLLQHACLHCADTFRCISTSCNTRLLLPNGQGETFTSEKEEWNICGPGSIQRWQSAPKDIGRKRGRERSWATRARERVKRKRQTKWKQRHNVGTRKRKRWRKGKRY